MHHDLDLEITSSPKLGGPKIGNTNYGSITTSSPRKEEKKDVDSDSDNEDDDESSALLQVSVRFM